MKNLLIATAALATIAVSAPPATAQSFPSAKGITRQACAYEDSVDCIWDAKHRGNGVGRSFMIDKAGNLTYIPHRRAHRMLRNFAH